MSIIPIDTFHYLSIIISLYWTSKTLFSSSIITSEYLICNRFTAEYDIWEKEKDLENAKELVDEFERKLGAKVRRQKGVEQR